MRAKDKAVSVRLCFVCLGNICRSPTAEAIMRGIVEQEGLGDTITIESAGTGGWHVGEKPDARSRDAGKIRGLKIDGRAQQFTSKHFERYDHVVAMDTSNQRDLLSMATTNLDKEKVSLLRGTLIPHHRNDPMCPILITEARVGSTT